MKLKRSWSILKILWKKVFNRDLLLFFFAVLVLFMAQKCGYDNREAETAQEASVLAVVADSTHYYKDKLNREVASKRVMEANLAVVEQKYRLLSANQQALVQDVKQLPKQVQKKLVTASSVKQVLNVVLRDTSGVVGIHGTTWVHQSDLLAYSITTRADTLQVDSIKVKNRIQLNHYFDEKNVLHVTATNDNPLFRTLDIDAIIPPQKQKTGFRKTLTLICGGVVTGLLLSTLMK